MQRCLRVRRALALLALCAPLLAASAATAHAQRGAGAFRLGVHAPVGSVLAADGGDAVYQIGPTTSSGLDLAYQVTDMIAVGGSVAAALFGRTGETGSDIFLLALVPRFELGVPTGESRFYGAIDVGAGTGGGLGATGSTIAMFVVGAEIGAHLFATRSFSVSPYLQARHVRAFDHDLGIWSASIGIAITGWMGGHDREAVTDPIAAPGS
jgi:hypothetical protein